MRYFFIAIAYFLPLAATAQQQGVKLLEPTIIGGTTDTEVTLATYIQPLFRQVVTILIALAVILLIVAGVQYALPTAGAGDKSEAKDRFWRVVVGLILALSGYVILRTINPALVSFELTNIIPPLGTGSQSSGVPSNQGSGSGSGGGEIQGSSGSLNQGNGGPSGVSANPDSGQTGLGELGGANVLSGIVARGQTGQLRTTQNGETFDVFITHNPDGSVSAFLSNNPQDITTFSNVTNVVVIPENQSTEGVPEVIITFPNTETGGNIRGGFVVESGAIVPTSQ